MEIIKKNLSLIIFTIITLFLSLGYVGYIFLQGGLGYAENETAFGEIGKFLGTLGGFALVIVYARTFLKILIGSDDLWKRLEPLQLEQLEIKKKSIRLLVLLNKTHAYFGVLAVVLIFLHCYLTGSYLDNLLLQIVLVLLGIEAVTGFVMKVKYTPAQLKQKSYLIHRQFVIGTVLLILTMFGHLILGD